LARQPWRGNVRELKNFIYRLSLLAREDLVDAASLAPMLEHIRGPESPTSGAADDLAFAVASWFANNRPPGGAVYDQALAAFERPLFIEVLKETGGNQLRAAQVLGINRNTLRKRLGELGIEPELLARRD
jgi:two-component system, NtrC family, nitrogen regulation response regulator GlnG